MRELNSKFSEGKGQNQSKKLIYFDGKVRAFLLILLITFILLVFFKINGSSIGIWNQQLPAEGISKKTDIIYGTPKSIRSDEWLVGTPSLLSQYYHGFSKNNPAIGAAHSPFVMNLPVADITLLFKPMLWGYYFLDIERGFAFYWNMKQIGMIVSVFLMLMLLTSNHFVLSVGGALWIAFASAVQWWFSTPLPDYIVFLGILFTCFIYFLFVRSKVILVIASIGLLLFGYSFITLLYPAWQIPFFYTLIFLLTGYVVMNYDPKIIFSSLVLKISLLTMVLVAMLGILLYTYLDLKETIDLLTHTVYPGKRDLVGGDATFMHLFHNNYFWFISDNKLPAKWGNVCEVSSFLFFYPVVLLYFYRVFKNGLKPNLTMVLLTIFILFNLAYILIGFPSFLAKITLFNIIPSGRALAALGIPATILAILFLKETKDQKEPFTLVEKLGFFVFIFIVLLVHGFYTNDQVDNFFKTNQIIVSSVAFSLIFLLFTLDKFVYRDLMVVAIIILVQLPNFKINPANKGLGALMNHPYNKQVHRIVESDKTAKFIVMGGFTLSNFFKASGAEVFGGATFVPDFERMKILDPLGVKDSIYNRYAHINTVSYVNGRDSVVFQLVQNDLYTLALDPCSPKLKQMGINYIIFAYQPQPAETRCMTLVDSHEVLIYKINP